MSYQPRFPQRRTFAPLLPPIQAVVKAKKILVKFSYSEVLVAKIRAIPASLREWKKDTKTWYLTPAIETISFLSENNAQMSELDLARLGVMLDRILHREETAAERLLLSQATTAAPIREVQMELLTTPHDFQWVPTQYALLNPDGFMLCDEQGLGKTLQALMISLLPKYRNKPVLLASPVVSTMQKEIMDHLGEHSVIIDGPLPHLYPGVRFYLCPYNRLKFVIDDKKKNIPYPHDWFFILDEGHKVKNPKTLQTQYARAIARKASCYRLPMTGTPVLNRPEELYQMLVLLGLEMSWTQFMRQYCGLQWTDGGRDYSGAVNLADLNRFCYSNYFVRREKKQVLKQLPDKVRQAIEIKQTPVRIDCSNMFEAYAKNAQLKAADPEFLDWLRDCFDCSTKMIIFGYHQVMLDAIQAQCEKYNHQFVRIDGKTDQFTRQGIVNEFQNHPDCKVAILSIGCGALGLTLTEADLVVFAELDFVPGIVEQCEDRAHRMGQKSTVNVIYTIYSLFEQKLAYMLLEKLNIIKRITSHTVIEDSVDNVSMIQQIAREMGMTVGKNKAGQ